MSIAQGQSAPSAVSSGRYGPCWPRLMYEVRYSGANSHSSMQFQSKTLVTWPTRRRYSRWVSYWVSSTPKAHTPMPQQKTPEISCITTSLLGTIVADIHGSIFVLNREFEVVSSWVAHNGGRVTHMVEQKKILITLGVRSLDRNTLENHLICSLLRKKIQ